MVGKLARMRVSSVIRISPPRTSIGTLKSTRTNTRFPRTSKSRSVSFGILLVLLLVLVLMIMLMLMLLLMIVLVRICSFILTQELRALRKPFEHSHEHVNDAHELLFRGNNSLGSDELSHYEDVKTRRALKRRAACHFEKSRAIFR